MGFFGLGLLGIWVSQPKTHVFFVQMLPNLNDVLTDSVVHKKAIPKIFFFFFN
jgi:hypothetical protein